MDIAKRVLETLRRTLIKTGLPEMLWDFDGRLTSLLRTPEKIPRTLIAVVGKTGAGKSSLLNALLDVALLPKGSTMSCTAIPTKIKFHPESTYRAKIKVMRPAEWTEEIETAKRLLASEEELDDEPYPDKGAQGALKSALDRVRTIYPRSDPFALELIGRLADTDLKNKSVDALLEEPYVQTMLKTVRFIESTNLNDFAHQISLYIDAKPTFFSDHDGSPPSWPLVKQVTVYVNSRALSTGVSLIDLPGVGDTNAARSEQAGKFLSKCDALWIVTDIVRAETDDVAAKLLTTAMRNDLLMDGLYNSATFICTRTDNPDCEDLSKRMRLEHSNKDFVAVFTKLTELNKSTLPQTCCTI